MKKKVKTFQKCHQIYTKTKITLKLFRMFGCFVQKAQNCEGGSATQSNEEGKEAGKEKFVLTINKWIRKQVNLIRSELARNGSNEAEDEGKAKTIRKKEGKRVGLVFFVYEIKQKKDANFSFWMQQTTFKAKNERESERKKKYTRNAYKVTLETMRKVIDNHYHNPLLLLLSYWCLHIHVW